MRARKSSALSDLIRQATATEGSDPRPPSESIPFRQSERVLIGASGNAPATAEELAEAFFPGSSIREHAFFPKSLTAHSQLSQSHTHYGFLTGYKPGSTGQAGHQDIPQPGAPLSPSFGSVRGPSTAINTGRSSPRQHSIAEDGDGGADGAHRGPHHHHRASGSGVSVSHPPSGNNSLLGGPSSTTTPQHLAGAGPGGGAAASVSANGAAGGGGSSWGSSWQQQQQRLLMLHSPSPGVTPTGEEGGTGTSYTGFSQESHGSVVGGARPNSSPDHHHHHQPPFNHQPSPTRPSPFVLREQMLMGRAGPRGGVISGSTAGEAGRNQGYGHQYGEPVRQQYGRSVMEEEGGASGGWAAESGGGGGGLTEPLLGMSRRSSTSRQPQPSVVRVSDDVEAAATQMGPGAQQLCMEAGGMAMTSPVESGGAALAAAAAAAAAVNGVDGGGHTVDVRRRSSFFNAVVFGMINAVVSMPTMIAYAAIVFKAPLYGPYLDSLCRFFFFSSAVHQLVFVGMSTLPFAIGQVQDVGLIFLSAMASDIALRLSGPSGDGGGGKEGGDVAAVALGSSLLVMTVSTFVVGLLTLVVARLKLADMVSYVPLPVVGGYLGFVGYFCIAGGTALAAGVQVDSLTSWINLLAPAPALKLLPAAATIAALITVVARVEHPLALPGLLMAVPFAFHGVLAAAGWTLEQAQEAGWVMKPTAGLSNCWQLWGLFNLQHGGLTGGGVSFPAMLAQLPKVAGLFLVVCFGSCMDVAAIQSDMPRPLDFNRELATVGVSNMVTGALGAGYTGSYIFSQTVFTMRQGVFNRVNGLVVGVVELLVFALPFSVVQYMPNFFFGALLVWFGIEISKDWLILSYRKLSRSEYLLLWGTFLAIMNFGLELGIGIGIVLATLYFAYQYAQSQVSSLRHMSGRSSRTHSYDTATALDLLFRRLAVLQLGGFVFFGSSTGLSKQLLQLAARMLQERADEQRQHEEWAAASELGSSGGSSGKEGGNTAGAGGEGAVLAPTVNGGGSGGGGGGGGGTRQHNTDMLLAAPAAAAAAPAAAALTDPGAAEQSGTAVAAAAPPPAGADTANAGRPTTVEGALRGFTSHELEIGSVGGSGGGSGIGDGVGGGKEAVAAAAAGNGLGSLGVEGGGAGGPLAMSVSERHWRSAAALSLAPVVLILDFGAVTGLDSTAARTIATLVSTLASQRVNVIFTNMRRSEGRQLLEANGLPLVPFALPGGGAGAGGGGGGEGMGGVGGDTEGKCGGGVNGGGLGVGLGVAAGGGKELVAPVGESPLLRPSSGGCWEFSSVAGAVRAVEDAYLRLAASVGLLGAAPCQTASLLGLLGRHMREVFPSAPTELGPLVAALEGALSRRQLQLGEVVYGAGAPVRELYIIELGTLVEDEHYEGGVRVGVREHGAGVVVGCLEFFLSRPALATVRTASTACQLLVISHAAYSNLMSQSPRALAALQVLLLRATCSDLAAAQEAAHHGAAV